MKNTNPNFDLEIKKFKKDFLITLGVFIMISGIIGIFMSLEAVPK